jgi:hypothetical protein
VWSYRHLSVVLAIATLLSLDAFVAAQAGAALEPAVNVSATTSPDAAAPLHAATTTTVPRRATVPRVRRRPKAVAKVRVAAKRVKFAKPKPPQPKPPVPKPPVITPMTAPSPPPTDCPAILLAVVWPWGWHANCAGGRAGLLGLTAPSGTTTLYVRPGESVALLRSVALHEAGHAWNFSHLNPDKIAQWCSSRGCDAAHFFSGGAHGAGWSEPGGAEDWAASWDVCHGGEYHAHTSDSRPPAPRNARCRTRWSATPPDDRGSRFAPRITRWRW